MSLMTSGSDVTDGLFCRCQYLMTINSPHLCSLRGFHIPTIDDEPAQPVNCRRIVPDNHHGKATIKFTVKEEHAVRVFQVGDNFPRGYPVPPHGAAWQLRQQRKGGRVKYPSIEADAAAQTVVVKGAKKARKNAKAIEAERMDEDSHKAWLAEERAKKIALRENIERVVEESKRIRQDMWNERWDVKVVRKLGWLLGVDEQEYREWWEGMMDELDEEDARESEKRRMKV